MVLGATGGDKLLYDVVVGCGQGMSDMLRSPPSPVDENITINKVVIYCVVVHDLLQLLGRLNLHRNVDIIICLTCCSLCGKLWAGRS